MAGWAPRPHGYSPPVPRFLGVWFSLKKHAHGFSWDALGYRKPRLCVHCSRAKLGHPRVQRESNASAVCSRLPPGSLTEPPLS